MLQEQSLWHDKDPSQLKDHKHPTKAKILQPFTGNEFRWPNNLQSSKQQYIVRGEFWIIIKAQKYKAVVATSVKEKEGRGCTFIFTGFLMQSTLQKSVKNSKWEGYIPIKYFY